MTEEEIKITQAELREIKSLLESLNEALLYLKYSFDKGEYEDVQEMRTHINNVIKQIRVACRD